MLRSVLILALAGLPSFLSTPNDPVARETALYLDQLAYAPTPVDADFAAANVLRLWGQSGSATVDLLLEQSVSGEEAGDIDRADELLSRAITLDPDHPEIYTRRAALRFDQKDIPGALADLDTALQLEPRHFVAWAGLGSVLEEVGAHEGALRAYRRALEIHPHYEPARRGEARMSARIEGLPA